MSDIGNSNRISRAYLDSLLIETRYMDAVSPATDFELYGQTFSSPIMTAALSHLDHFMFEGASRACAQGAADADCALWIGMADEAEIEMCVSTGAKVIEIIKPYADRAKIEAKIAHAEKCGLLAVGIDIDHPFASDGSPDIVDGEEMAPMTSRELAQICAQTKLPVIVKGVLSLRDADRSLCAGAKGLVLSHHNNRIEYALPPVSLLPQVSDMACGVPVFVDCEIQTGMDAFKALALGASGVCIGRPLMTAIKQDKEHGVCAYLNKARDELKKAMAYTGTPDLAHFDRSVIHFA